MTVFCVVYRTMLTPGALFSVCFTEQCLLLELCSHDCSLCSLQNNAYYWSFVLMLVHCVVYRTVLTTGALVS